jgi:hypothetical protein
VRHLSQLATPIVDTTAVVVNMGRPRSAQEGNAARHETRPSEETDWRRCRSALFR